jgi:hypothetical protein
MKQVLHLLFSKLACTGSVFIVPGHGGCCIACERFGVHSPLAGESRSPAFSFFGGLISSETVA